MNIDTLHIITLLMIGNKAESNIFFAYQLHNKQDLENNGKLININTDTHTMHA